MLLFDAERDGPWSKNWETFFVDLSQYSNLSIGSNFTVSHVLFSNWIDIVTLNLTNSTDRWCFTHSTDHLQNLQQIMKTWITSLLMIFYCRRF